jgi:microcin C transport system permease protein
MGAYFLRRLLLIPPTLLGITLVVFGITRFVPGGPVDEAIREHRAAGEAHGRGGALIRSANLAGQDTALSQEQIEQLKRYYGFDRPWYLSYVQWLGRILQGDLGTSYRYNEPVWDLMRERIPISLFYGITTVLVTYGVCLPLGVVKAMKHNSATDTVTSVVVFIGYALPGYVLAVLLVVFLAARLRWFPMGGFTSTDFASLGAFAKVGDILHHAVLPLVCYLVGSFASVTFLIKNQLLDHLAADYMRTAIAKGVPYREAVTHHALRNSLIPLATGFGGLVTILFTGSFLIETIFDIDGFGLLGYTSVVDRDYPVVMGTLFVGALLLLLGNILSDVAVAFVDPRVKFS